MTRRERTIYCGNSSVIAQEATGLRRALRTSNPRVVHLHPEDNVDSLLAQQIPHLGSCEPLLLAHPLWPMLRAGGYPLCEFCNR